MKLQTTKKIQNQINSFANVDLKNRKHNFKHPAYILAWIGLGLGALVFISCFIEYTIIIVKQQDISIYDSKYAMWFDCFSYFTQMSNVAVLVYYVLFFCALRSYLFKTRNYATVTAVAINTTMLVYASGILPAVIFQSMKQLVISNYWLSILQSCFFHGVLPIIFDVHYFLSVNYPSKTKQKNPINRIFGFNNVIYILIVILIYWIYSIVINFISMPDIFRDEIRSDPRMQGHFYYTIYGFLTNYNPKCYDVNWFDEHIKMDFDHGGNYITLINIFAILCICYSIYTAIYFANNAIATNKKLKQILNSKDQQKIDAIAKFAKEAKK